MTDTIDPAAAGRERLIAALMEHVGFDGWSDRAVAAASRDAGFDGPTVARLFPGGIPDMVEAASDAADAAMVRTLIAAPLESMKVRERIAFAVRARLEYLAPWHETARRTASWLAMPQNAPLGVRLAGRTVDRMWRGIGDVSTDFNFYTKRALLLGVFTATFLYWLDDTSDGAEDSWRFLDRRIADVLKIPTLGARARAFCRGLWPRGTGGAGSQPYGG